MAELHADIIVVGAGPAGLAAAACAAESGKRVLVLDESPRPGGQIWRHRERRSLPVLAQRWLERFDRSGAKLISGASVVDITEGTVIADRDGEAVITHASAIILCVGARELFLPFPGWTLPGVVGVGGGQALLKAGTSVAGKTAVIAGTGPLLLPVAAAFAKAGANVRLVADQAPLARMASFALGLWRAPAKILDGARYRSAFARTPYKTGTWVTRANGDEVVREVVITDGRSTQTLPCDILCVGYNLVPSVELPRLAGCGLDEHGNVMVNDRQETTQRGVFCAGETTGLGGVDAALVEGQIAGYAAAGVFDRAQRLFGERAKWRAFAHRLKHTFALRDELKKLPDANTIVCRCEDVRYGQLSACASQRDAKLHTRAGMGACQGRICGAALRHHFGWNADTIRTPIAPVTVSTLSAGGTEPVSAGG